MSTVVYLYIQKSFRLGYKLNRQWKLLLLTTSKIHPCRGGSKNLPRLGQVLRHPNIYESVFHLSNLLRNQIVVSRRNQNRKLKNFKALLHSQAQGTTLFKRMVLCPGTQPEEHCGGLLFGHCRYCKGDSLRHLQ